MPQITSHSEKIAQLTGLHLWHAPLSSCSQRVRLVLAETGQGYESHLLDLEKGEHATAEYQAIHPKGVVPALVDEGCVFIESIDIIRHLARHDPALGTQSDDPLLDRADKAQADLKLLTFEFLFRAKPPPPQGERQAFFANHKNEWLRQFYYDFATGFGTDRITAAVRRTHEGFEALERRLSYGNLYLSGRSFGLTDIAWLPNLHRMGLMGWPFENLPYLSSWLSRVKARPSYRTALIEWQDAPAIGAFENYTERRREDGTDVRAYLKLTEDAAVRDITHAQ